MTFAYYCVLAASAIPYLFVLYAKGSPEFLKKDYNKNPREYEEGLKGARKRAYWAHLNGFEAFPPFAAAVIIAHSAEVDQSMIDMLAVTFILLRIIHGLLYIANLDKLRSLCWTCGFVCVVALFILAA